MGDSERDPATPEERAAGTTAGPEPRAEDDVEAIFQTAEDDGDALVDYAAGAEQEIAELRDAYVRVLADFENYRRRVARERRELRQQVRVEVVRGFLPVLDNLTRAVEAAEQHGAEGAWAEGLRMVLDQFAEALRAEGVEAMECVGREFDPRFHEVVATIPSADVTAGAIAEEVRRGYRCGDMVVRASQVVTSSGPPQ